MAVGLSGNLELLPVEGVRLAVAQAGIRKPGRDDLMLMEICEGASAAAVFTRNAFCAAPVVVARQHLAAAMPRALLVNSGNANAGTGSAGMEAALASCAAAAQLAGCAAEQVLPYSTGVIGEPLPVDRIEAALPGAWGGLAEDAWPAAARAIMTTDTVPKGASRRLTMGGREVTLTGIAKGAGMIRPDMATMLAFLATDAAVEPALLQACLVRAVNHSFNRITIDGDTSTNDACTLVATGRSGVRVDTEGADYAALCAAVESLCTQLAQAIVRDGEGATKFVTVQVDSGASEEECLQVAYTIAHSPLVKTALFASDPNWGRVLAAVGRAGLADLELDAVTIHLGEVCIVRDGGRAPDYTEGRGQGVMSGDEITIRVDLARGTAAATVWTTDFSYDYVRINAEYRT